VTGVSWARVTVTAAITHTAKTRKHLKVIATETQTAKLSRFKTHLRK
jgi:hypothetical protein